MTSNWRDTVAEQQQTAKSLTWQRARGRFAVAPSKTRFEAISVLLYCINDCESPRKSAVACTLGLKIRLN